MPEKIDNKKMVLDTLAQTAPTDDQIIDLLLLLLDDWEVRAAVMTSVRTRVVTASSNQVVTQTVTKKD